MIAPPCADAAGGLLADDEGAADVGAVHAVEVVEVQLGQRRQQHDAGGVDDHVDAPELRLGLVEQRRDLGFVGDVGADHDRPAAAATISSTTAWARSRLPA